VLQLFHALLWHGLPAGKHPVLICLLLLLLLSAATQPNEVFDAVCTPRVHSPALGSSFKDLRHGLSLCSILQKQ
jgi:hypothetical protein